ncbi:MAG: hypothetical protein WBK76_05640 [Candidatus Saccharimonadales bacterium]
MQLNAQQAALAISSGIVGVNLGARAINTLASAASGGGLWFLAVPAAVRVSQAVVVGSVAHAAYKRLTA